MAKRKLYALSALTIFLIAGGLTALAIAAKHEPAFYVQTEIPEGAARKDRSNNFINNFGQMLANRKQEEWGCVVSQAEINSFFAEKLDQQGEMQDLRRLGIHAPRIVLSEDGQVRFAFRYGSGFFSTIISYDLKIWLAPKEPNVIVVQFQSARAGALPISNRTILQQFSEFAQKQNFAVNLYRHEGHTVAVVDLRGDAQQATSILTMLAIEPQKLSIRGKTLANALAPLDPNKHLKKTAAQ